MCFVHVDARKNTLCGEHLGPGHPSWSYYKIVADADDRNHHEGGKQTEEVNEVGQNDFAWQHDAYQLG